MSHIQNMLNSIKDHDLKRKVEEQCSKPMPKLGFAEVPIYLIDLLTSMERISDKYMKWQQPDKPVDDHMPITCRILNLSSVLKDHNAKQMEDTIVSMIKYLRKHGCNAVLYPHQYYDEGGTTRTEQCVAVPCTALMKEGDEKPSITRDIESAGKFIAHILNKKYATEAEIEAVFGTAFLEEGKLNRSPSKRTLS